MTLTDFPWKKLDCALTVVVKNRFHTEKHENKIVMTARVSKFFIVFSCVETSSPLTGEE
jgi:hypothetical protein